MISFKNQTVTVIRPNYIAERGNQVPDWTGASEHQVTGCRVQPTVGGEEQSTTRDAIVARWTLFAPAGADIDARDRVRHNGLVYDIDGELRNWSSPTGSLAHIEADLLRVKG